MPSLFAEHRIDGFAIRTATIATAHATATGITELACWRPPGVKPHYGAPIAFVRGLAVPLPFRAARFDRVVVSLVLHHLTTAAKRHTVADIFRVVRPGGAVHIAAFGKQHTPAAAAIGRLVEYFEEAVDEVDGRFPDMLGAARFRDVAVTANFLTVTGTRALVRARRPAD